MAEMNVPAWPIPIHQTKLVIPNAQATGMLLPQTPMPVDDRVRDRRRRGPASRAPVTASAGRIQRGGAASTRREELVGERGVSGSADEHGLEVGRRGEVRVDGGSSASSGLGFVDPREVLRSRGRVPSSSSTA